MIFFITFLRALAACFITNAHYTGIYPTDLIANGGLIGDVIFFAVSGYCLYNIKMPFLRWYGKRIYRVYPPVLIMTAIYVIAGTYSLTEHNVVWWFIYPTYYHFVASIIVLYIPFYFIIKVGVLKKHLPVVMGIIAVIWLIVYVTIFDKSFYHIDTVREPMIRFLFMESMLLGAYFRQNDNKFRNKFKVWYPIATILMFLIYFACKLMFSHRQSLAALQILNQYAILALLFFMFMTFAGLDSKLDALPQWIKKVIEFLSSITLEIYVVQYVLIELQYYIKLKRKLNLKNPKRYTEKLQWYKLYYRNEKMPICVDKYRVREYITEKGQQNILVKLYAVYDSAEEIDISKLPEKFILKTTNGSGTNIICKDKRLIDEKELKEKVKTFLKQSSASAGREWPYSYVTPRIIVEELLEDRTTADGSVNDYKFLCFNGKPEYIVLDVDRFTNHKRNIYDTEWNDLRVDSDCPCSDEAYAPPENLSEMLDIAEILCKDFPAVRVDLYSVGGKVYFGELTFFPWSGYVQYRPDSFDFEAGEKFKLPTRKGKI